MEPLHVNFTFERFENASTFSPEIQSLLKRCVEAMQSAYAPYSKFHVGAALLLEDGTVVLGNNQENAAYPSGLCAERVAIFAAGANHPQKRITAIAITAASANYTSGDPVTPCGACRQSMLEYELKQDSPIPLYLLSPTGQVTRIPAVSQLLPLHFDAKNLL
jgi:cytidine deaminase